MTLSDASQMTRAVYWLTLIAALSAACLSVYDFLAFNLPRMMAELADGLPGLFRISPALALPVAIALALALRSKAAIWLFGIHALAYRLHYFLGADPFEGQGTLLPGLFRHPLTILSEGLVLIYLARAGALR